VSRGDAGERPSVLAERAPRRRPEVRLHPANPTRRVTRRRDRTCLDVREDVEERLGPERRVRAGQADYQNVPESPSDPRPMTGVTLTPSGR
jgi:hypothetical protein